MAEARKDNAHWPEVAFLLQSLEMYRIIMFSMSLFRVV